VTLSVAASSFIAPTGNVNASAGSAPTLSAPSGLAVGDLYVVTAIFGQLASDSENIWTGFTRISAEITNGTRLMISQARWIEDAADLADVQSVEISGGAASTRVVAVGVALRSSLGDHRPSAVSASEFDAHASTTSLTCDAPSPAGSLRLTCGYSNTGGGNTAPTYSLVGAGSIVQQQTAQADGSPTSSSTSLVVASGGTGFTASPAFTNGGAYALGFSEVEISGGGETPDPGADPGPDSDVIASGDDLPTVTYAVASTTAPMTPLSAGWYREKRVDEAEAGPGQDQSSTAGLDLDGSTFFYYPGVPLCDAFPGNPAQYVETPYKPGGQPQAARWLFNVEFVVGNTHRVELRLSSPGSNPAIGMILVNGKRIADQMVTADGIFGGQGYRVFLDFPTAERRVIKIYGLNGNSGRFGGVAVEDGGWVIKPNRTITRRVAFITDSLGNGSGAPPDAGRGTETWLWDFARHLSADEVVQAGIGGTGYVKTIGGLGESTFRGRLAEVLATDPDVLVIQGGQNDVADPAVQAEVEAIMAASSAVPERIIVSTTQSAAVRAYILAGLPGGVDVVAVQDRPFEIGTDGVHPTFEGHRELAAAVIERYENGSPPPPDPEQPNGWQIRDDLLPEIRSLRELRVEGSVNATAAGGGLLVQGPGTVEIDDYVIVALVFQNGSGATTFQAPAGWTMLGDRGTSGNRMLVLFGRAIRNGTDRAAAMGTFTVYASTSSTRVAGVALSLVGIDLDSPVFDVGSWSVATSSVDSLAFTGGEGARSLTFVYSNNSAGGPYPQHDATTGTKLGQVTSPEDETPLPAGSSLSVHYGSDAVAFTPNAANAGGYRIAFRQRLPKVGFPVRVVYDGQYHAAQLDTVALDGALRECTPVPWPVPVKERSVGTLLAGNPFYIAHRGSGDLWPEHTMKSYAESVAHGMDAIEVSVNMSSDGVLLCHHDLTTTRMTGVNHTIRSTPWATLSGLMNTSSYTVDGSQLGQPIPRLVDVLDAFADTHVIFIEAKHSDAATPLLNMMDTYAGGTQRFVWKQYGPSSAGTADAKSRGYKTWGYGWAAELPTLPTWGANHDYIGVAHTCTDQQVQQYVTYGKPTIMWEIHTPEDRDRAVGLGVRGMMTSNIKSVMRTPVAT
jgi:glycerophosphoryl diester phosphodiesterase/lysophospholipase L1-like esterase